MMFPGLHPMAMMSTSNMGFTSRGSAGFPGGMYGAGPAPYPSMYQSSIPATQSGGPQGGDTQVCAVCCSSCFLFQIMWVLEQCLQNIDLVSLSINCEWNTYAVLIVQKNTVLAGNHISVHPK